MFQTKTNMNGRQSQMEEDGKGKTTSKGRGSQMEEDLKDLNGNASLATAQSIPKL